MHLEARSAASAVSLGESDECLVEGELSSSAESSSAKSSQRGVMSLGSSGGNLWRSELSLDTESANRNACVMDSICFMMGRNLSRRRDGKRGNEHGVC